MRDECCPYEALVLKALQGGGGGGTDGYSSVKIDSTISTLGELRELIDDINEQGKHVFFDFSEHISGAYVCTVQSYTENNVNYLWIKDILNNKKYGGYAGYSDDTTIEDYISDVNVQTEMYTISITDETMTEADMLEYLNGINAKGDSVFFNVSALGALMYLCSIVIDTTNNTIRISDITGKRYIGSYEPDKTIYECLEEAVDDICTLTVTCRPSDTEDTTILTGIEVNVYDGEDRLLSTKTFNGSPVAFPLPVNQTYRVTVPAQTASGGVTYFAPSTTNPQGTLLTDATMEWLYDSTMNITTMQGVKAFLALDIPIETKRTALVSNGTNNFQFPVPMYLDGNPLTPENVPHRVLEVDAYEKLVDGEVVGFVGAKCQPVYTVTSIVWDEREQEECDASETFSADLMYFTATTTGVGDKAFTQLTAGTDYTVGDNIGDYMTEHSVFVFKNGLRNNSNELAANTDLVRHGSNIYHLSKVHKWLNGTGSDWAVSSHVGDKITADKVGYKSWFAPEMLALIEDNVAWGVYERAGFELPNNKIWCQFALPSVTEFAGSGNANEGTATEYWKYLNGGVISNGANANRVMKNKAGSNQTMWFRSPFRSHSRIAWYLGTSGGCGNATSYAFGSYAAAPLFVI